MAVSGPKPKPVELKVLEGNPGKRKLPKSPKFAPLTEHPPKDLTPTGQALWRRLTQEFGHTSLLQRTDRELLLMACDCYSVYQANMKLVRQYGSLITARNNNDDRSALIVNPAWRVARDAMREFNAIAAKFGLSPSDRARLNIDDVGEDDDPILHLLT